MRRRMRWTSLLALGFALLFAVLAALVATGITQSLDVAAISHTRPGDEWGASQLRFSPWMARLDPARMFLLLALTTFGAAAWRRSWSPLVFSVALAGTITVVTLSAKFAVRRADPHGYVTVTGGSYPSGHMIALLACLGGCLLVVWPRVRWWFWTPVVAAAALMTTAQLVSAAHWPSDLLGSWLLALAVLSAASGTRLRQRASGAEPDTPDSLSRGRLTVHQVPAGTPPRN